MTLFQAQIDQAMVEVAAIRSEERPAFQKATEHGEEGVKNGYAQGQDRQCQANQGGGFHEADHTGSGNGVAQEKAATVSHEDRGGVEIEEEKAAECPQQGQHEDRHDVVLAVQGKCGDDGAGHG